MLSIPEKYISEDEVRELIKDQIFHLIDDLTVSLSQSNGFIYLQFHEKQPVYKRQIYVDKIDSLFKKKLRLLANLKIDKLGKESWFSVLWSPQTRLSSAVPKTSFLMHYAFQPSAKKGELQALETIACFPINFEIDFWLSDFSGRPILKLLKEGSKDKEHRNQSMMETVKM